MSLKWHQKIGHYAVCAFIVFCISGFISSAPAAELTKAEVQAVLQESTRALLTGQEFSPELQQKQQLMKGMFQTGVIGKAELAAMVEATILPVLNNHKTTRYILKKAPERINALFSPYLDWEEVRTIVWKAGSSVIKDGDQVVITIGTLAPPGTPWINVPETVLVPRMAQLSNNKVLIKIYGGGVMGEDTDILRKMDIGQLDGCGCTALGILAASPETSVFLVPGMYHNYNEIDYIYEKFRERIDKAFEDRGYILAALIDTGYFYIFSKYPVNSLADLKKQKVLTWFGAVETTLFGELGIDPTPVAVPEIVSALSTGLANTNLAPAAWMLGMQAYQYSNYYLKPPLLFSPAAVVVSNKTKDRLMRQFKLSDVFASNIQELLVYEVGTLEPQWKKLSREYEAKSLNAFETKCGMKAVTLSAEDQKTLAQAALKVQEKLADKTYPRDLMNDMQQALKEYRSRR